MSGWFPDGYFAEYFSEYWPIYGTAVISTPFILDISISRFAIKTLGISQQNISDINIERSTIKKLEVDK